MNRTGKGWKLALALGVVVVVVLADLVLRIRPEPIDTPFFRGTIERTGFVKERTFLPSQPRVLWSYSMSSTPHDPIVVDSVVYAGEDSGTLHAIRVDNGRALWRSDCGDGQIFTSPTIVGERIFFTDGSGVSAVSRDDGVLLWQLKIPGGAGESSPLPVGDRLFVGGKDGYIYAVTLDGQRLWKRDIIQKRRGSSDRTRPRVASSDGNLLFQPLFDQSRLVALRCDDGKIAWSFQAKGWIYGNPTVTDRHIFIGSQDKKLYCLDKKNGKPIWSCPTGSRIEAGVALAGGAVYFGSCDRQFYRVSAATGDVDWTYKTGGVIYSSPLVADGVVYFGSFDGYLYALNTRTGEETWKIQPHKGAEVNSTPSTDGRHLFIATRRVNAIVAIGDEFWD